MTQVSTHNRGPRDEPVGPESVDARSFFIVLLIGALCGAAVFVWTVSSEPVAVRLVSSAGPDPAPGWGSRFARPAFEEGRYEALAASAAARRRDWGRDPEAWLFGALAHEAMASEPGLRAIEHRAAAERLWSELRALAADRDRDGDGIADFQRPIANSAYLEGWALAGLGRPVMAQERFGRFLEQMRPRAGQRIGAYNRACYNALAGQHAEAVRLWRVSFATGQIGDRRWGVVDPDLDPVRAELWQADLGYRVWRLRVEAERRGEGRARGGVRWIQDGVTVTLPGASNGAF